MNERQAAAEATLAEIKVEAQEAELAASKKRAEARGWPINTPDGEVLVVRKIASAAGDTVVTEDGVEYAPDPVQPLMHVKVGVVGDDALVEEIGENGMAEDGPPANFIGDATPGVEDPSEAASDLTGGSE